MSGRIVLLGTGTCQLQEHRRASSVLIELDDLRVVFDIGRGIADRLASLGLRQDHIEHVVLSHFHPDHVSDLIPLLHAGSWSQIDPRRCDLNLYGPQGLKELVRQVLDLFGPNSLVSEDRFRLQLHELDDGSFRIAGREFVFADLPPAGNHGLKFTSGGKAYAFTGDSWLHEQEIAFLRGVELGVIDSGHLSDDEIVRLAVETQARRLVCSHLYRELDETALNSRAEKDGYRGALIAGHDRMTFDL